MTDANSFTIDSTATRAGRRARGALCWIALTVPALLLFGGCASLAPPILPGPSSTTTGAAASSQGWWYARFVMSWPPDTEPSWHVDLLLAQLCVSPVLNRFENEIKLWRFHRRAARDQAGHQFSFVFYADQKTAREVFATFRTDATLNALRTNGVMIRDEYDDPASITRPNIEDTSDPAWSVSVQKSWPYFIQGVSRMWLNLIADVSGSTATGKPPTNLDEALGLYRRVDMVIERMWREEGQHALLHHLNAVFGYKPLVMQHRFLLGF